MKHPFNHQLFAYWNERRGLRPAPDRGDIDPVAVRRILGDSFMLGSSAAHGQQFRVAGTRICALFGRELRGEAFAMVWDAASAPQIRDLTDAITEDGIGIVAGARTTTADDQVCHFELLLLPLVHDGEIGRRIIGVLAALDRPFWLGTWNARPLSLGAVQFVGPGNLERGGFGRSKPVNSRSFAVIPGGRS